jgi:hypothetical protein
LPPPSFSEGYQPSHGPRREMDLSRSNEAVTPQLIERGAVAAKN